MHKTLILDFLNSRFDSIIALLFTWHSHLLVDIKFQGHFSYLKWKEKTSLEWNYDTLEKFFLLFGCEIFRLDWWQQAFICSSLNHKEVFVYLIFWSLMEYFIKCPGANERRCLTNGLLPLIKLVTMACLRNKTLWTFWYIIVIQNFIQTIRPEVQLFMVSLVTGELNLWNLIKSCEEREPG